METGIHEFEFITCEYGEETDEYEEYDGDEDPEQAEARRIHLTRREVQVLTLVIEGKSSKQVAEHIYISKRTVDYHLANIYKKLDVSNRVQAFREATRRNLLPLGGVYGIAM